MWIPQEGRIIGKLALKNWGGNLTEQGYKSKIVSINIIWGRNMHYTVISYYRHVYSIS